MVNSYKITKLPSLTFGVGTINTLPDLIDKKSDNVVIITGNNTIERSQKLYNVLKQIRTNLKSVQHFKIAGEPSPSNINHIVQQTIGKNITVISLGGGSPIDAGKAVSAMIPLQEDVTDYLEVVGNKSHPGIKMPFIAVPTTSGTGSEVTANAVISKIGTHGFKRSLRHVNFVPDQVILDPELTIDCPSEVTAFSGMDAITQLIEAYVSFKANRFTDSLIEDAMKNIFNSLINAFHNGNNIQARSDMMYAAYISGIALANAGLGMVHGFASELGGRYSIPHGLVCARLAYPCHRLNIEKAIKENHTRSIQKYARLYHLVTGNQSEDMKDSALRFIKLFKETSNDLHLPGFGSYGISTSHLSEIAKKSGSKNNPVEITYEEKLELLKQCLH